MSVVFPAPLGPSRQKTRPAPDFEIDAVEGGHRPPVEGLEDELPKAANDGIPLDQVLDEDGRSPVHFGSMIRRIVVSTGLRRRSAYRS